MNAGRILYIVAIEDIVRSPLLRSQVLNVLSATAAHEANQHFTLVSLYPIFNWRRYRAQIAALRQELQKQRITFRVLPILFLTRHFHMPWYIFPLFLLQAILAAGYLAISERSAIVHCRSYPAALVGGMIKLLGGAKLLFDTRTIYPEEATTYRGGVEGQGLDEISYRMWKGIERLLLKTADATTVVSQPSYQILAEQYPRFTQRLHTVYLSTRIENRQTLEIWRQQTRKDLKMADSIVVAYVGAWFSPERTLPTFRALLESAPLLRWWFLLLVSNQHPAGVSTQRDLATWVKDELQNRAECTSLSVPQQEVARYLAAADLGMLPIGNQALRKNSVRYQMMARTVLSTKFVEYLACGLPVLVHQGWAGAAAQIVNDEGLGLVYGDDMRPAFAAWIAQWRQEQTHYRQRAREYAQRNFSLDRVVDQYYNLYQQITKN
jgi:glycosyltransferase involved in cell wall biosynthesis